MASVVSREIQLKSWPVGLTSLVSPLSSSNDNSRGRPPADKPLELKDYVPFPAYR